MCKRHYHEMTLSYSLFLISNIVLLWEIVCLNIANRFKQKISKYSRMEHSEKILPASILLG